MALVFQSATQVVLAIGDSLRRLEREFVVPRKCVLQRFGFRVVAPALCILAMHTGASAAPSVLTPVSIAQITALAANPVSNRLLADDSTRRLRRLGINFSRTRLPRPYDPLGEIC